MHSDDQFPQRIIFLDYARVFAFLSVLIGHKFYGEITSLITSFSTPHITQQYLSNTFSSMFKGGGAGVVVFFMISGYIILHVLQKELSVEFIIKRIFRIYPLLIFAITIQVLLALFIHHGDVDISTTLSQMSLMGDFFNTPYSLSGVEWTLRTEIMFYFFMFILSFTTLLRDKGYTLLLILTLLTLSIKFIAPFPTANFTGYFTTYVPFLFVGSVIYMYEKRTINIVAMLLFIGLVFYRYFKAIEDYSPHWLNSNFAIVGFSIFLLLWLQRDKLALVPSVVNSMIMKLALLTYSVYLFHNFLWSYIEMFLSNFGFSSKFLIVIVLFIWCALMYLFIETPMNKFGRILSQKYMKRRG